MAKKLARMATVLLFWCAAGDKDIVDLGVKKMESTCDVIHKPLKSLRCVPQTKWHSEAFEWSKRSDDSRSRIIFRRQTDLIMSPD